MVSLVFLSHHCPWYQELWTSLLLLIVNKWNERKTIFPNMSEPLRMWKGQCNICSLGVWIPIQEELLHFWNKVRWNWNIVSWGFHFIVFKNQAPFTRPIVKTWKLAVLSVVSCSCAVHSSAQMVPVSCSHGSDVTNQLYFHWSRLSTNSLKQNLLQVAVVAWWEHCCGGGCCRVDQMTYRALRLRRSQKYAFQLSFITEFHFCIFS